MSDKRLTIDEENELFIRVANGDKDAIEELIEANTGLVRMVAWKYRGPGFTKTELENAGLKGLYEAILNYKPQGRHFSTYAVYVIKRYIYDFVIEENFTIRKPTRIVKGILRMRRVMSDLIAKNGIDPTEEQIADEMGITVKQLRKLMMEDAPIASLDQTIGQDDSGNDFSLGDTIADERTPDPLDDLIRRETVETVRGALDKLNERQRRIISARYGLTPSGKSYSVEEIAKQLGISRQAANKQLNKATEILKELLTELR